MIQYIPYYGFNTKTCKKFGLGHIKHENLELKHMKSRHFWRKWSDKKQKISFRLESPELIFILFCY